MDLKRRAKRDLDELRKKDEEAETARVFREFEATFSNNKKVIGTTFVKGGVEQAGENASGSNTTTRAPEKRSSSPVYYMPAKLPEKASPAKDNSVDVRKNRDKTSALSSSKKDKKSNLAAFKEELERLQQERQERKILKEKIKDIEKHTGTSLRMPEPSRPEVLLPEEMEEYLSSSGRSGSSGRRIISGNMENYIDSTDLNSTNIYMGNLSPTMNEEKLIKIFGVYGPLASVKMFWPRGDDAEERMKLPLCGFVAYMSRTDAENAMERLRQSEVLGYEMRVGWGKAVPTPNYPISVPKKLLERLAPAPLNGMPFNAQPETDEARELFEKHKSVLQQLAALPAGSSSMTLSSQIPLADMQCMLKGSSVKVSVPTDRGVVSSIHRTIEFVVREGPSFEAMLMQRERNNQKFEFLFNFRTNEHAYYRWKLFSILMGDAPDSWKSEPFKIVSDGPTWRPPPVDPFRTGMPADLIEEDPDFICRLDSKNRTKYAVDSGRSRDEERSSRKTGKMSHVFDDEERTQFRTILSQLTPERTSIASAMLFCVDHAESAEEICISIVQTLKNAVVKNSSDVKLTTSQDISRAIALLYLISDILHNSGSAAISGAWRFRKSFQSLLVEVFAHFCALRQLIDARLKAEQLKERVLRCCQAWEQWFLYPAPFIIRLQNIFLGIEIVPDTSAASAAVSATPAGGTDGNKSTKIAAKRASRWQPLSRDADETSTDTATPARDANAADDDEDIDGIPLTGISMLSNGAVQTNGLTKLSSLTKPSAQQQSLLLAYHDADDDDDEDIDGTPINVIPTVDSLSSRSSKPNEHPGERKRATSGSDQHNSNGRESPSYGPMDKYGRLDDNGGRSSRNGGDSDRKRKTSSSSAITRHSSSSSATRSKWDDVDD